MRGKYTIAILVFLVLGLGGCGASTGSDGSAVNDKQSTPTPTPTPTPAPASAPSNMGYQSPAVCNGVTETPTKDSTCVYVTVPAKQIYECMFDVVWQAPSSNPTGDGVSYQYCAEAHLRGTSAGIPYCVTLAPGTYLRSESTTFGSGDIVDYNITVTAIKGGLSGGESAMHMMCSLA